MKARNFVVLFLFLISHTSIAAENSGPGIGIGPLYSGIGINYSWSGAHDRKAISVGCTDYSSSMGYTCGPGFNWIDSDWLLPKSKQHALGLYAGLIGAKYERNLNRKSIYGIGVGYFYFLEGINQPGLNFGASVAYGVNDRPNSSDTSINDAQILLNVGYQF